MKLNKLYKNAYCLNVAFKVLEIIEDNGTSLILYGSWYNVGTKDHGFFIDYDEISIKKDDIKNWRCLNE
jgi:hypothetical protein